jgi:hypothetical protein
MAMQDPLPASGRRDFPGNTLSGRGAIVRQATSNVSFRTKGLYAGQPSRFSSTTM